MTFPQVHLQMVELSWLQNFRLCSPKFNTLNWSPGLRKIDYWLHFSKCLEWLNSSKKHKPYPENIEPTSVYRSFQVAQYALKAKSEAVGWVSHRSWMRWPNLQPMVVVTASLCTQKLIKFVSLGIREAFGSIEEHELWKYLLKNDAFRKYHSLTNSTITPEVRFQLSIFATITLAAVWAVFGCYHAAPCIQKER